LNLVGLRSYLWLESIENLRKTVFFISIRNLLKSATQVHNKYDKLIFNEQQSDDKDGEADLKTEKGLGVFKLCKLHISHAQ
jgi:hypothetical protein